MIDTETIDTNSIVFTEDIPATSTPTGFNPPTQAISNPIDFNSIKFGDEPPASHQPSVFERIATLATNPIGGVMKEAASYGVRSTQDIPIVVNDPRKVPDSQTFSNLTGIPKADIEQHYDKIKFLTNLAMSPAQAGFELGKDVSPATTLDIVGATMTPAILAGIVADPPLAIASLIAFSALDHILPTSKFIPTNATKDEAASIELIGMLAKGAVVGGFTRGLHGLTFKEFKTELSTTRNLKPLDYKSSDIIDLPLPPRPTPQTEPTPSTRMSPEEFATQDKRILKAYRAGKINAEEAGALREDLRVQAAPPIEYSRAEPLDTAKLVLIEQYTLKGLREHGLPEVITVTPDHLSKLDPQVIEKLGIDKQTAETAMANNLAVKVPAEKFVGIALDEALAEKSGVPQAQSVSVEGGQSALDSIQGTGETKTRGLSLSVEQRAIERGLTQGFGDLPEYQVTNMADQAKKADAFVKSDPEMAMKIAMGQEKAPPDVTPEAIFEATRLKFQTEGDIAELRNLATNSDLVRQGTIMGLRLRTLAERDPESAVGAIQDVVQAREQAVQRRLGKGKTKTLAKEVERISEEIRKEVSKSRISKETWADFISGLEC